MVMRLTRALARVGRIHVCSAPSAPTTVALGGADAQPSSASVRRITNGQASGLKLSWPQSERNSPQLLVGSSRDARATCRSCGHLGSRERSALRVHAGVFCRHFAETRRRVGKERTFRDCRDQCGTWHADGCVLDSRVCPVCLRAHINTNQ
eukprot:2182283-Prymnesium_polylepis.1